MNIKNPLFKSSSCSLFHKGTRDVSELMVYRCDDTGMIFTDPDFDFSELKNNEMYKGVEWVPRQNNSPDFEKMNQMLATENERRFARHSSSLEAKDVLDVGCGSGAFLKAAQSSVASLAGVEINQPSRDYARSLGFEVHASLDDVEQKYDVITLFHVLEHIKEPVALLEQALALLREDGIVIIEVPHGGDALLVKYDCDAFKRFTLWSDHLYLFTDSSFKNMIEGSAIRSLKTNHLMRFSLANHMHWLSQGKPGGGKVWDWLDQGIANGEYQKLLIAEKATDTIEFIVGRKSTD